MFEISEVVNHLSALQWFAAAVFVPLVCWQYCLQHSSVCRWCALISGYSVQIGFFLLLDDVGIQPKLLILIASVAAYFWITTTVAVWPQARSRQPVPSAEPEATS